MKTRKISLYCEHYERQYVDVTTVNETQTEGVIDEEQLRLAATQSRVLYSHNIGDFCQLHTEFIAREESHAGIALLSLLLFCR
ncbi:MULTISPECIES: DUF5615 family PIN-like protein [unclassified Microcoleus]|uniref:DUF5615 family PIN-like protein n=1 Tax=unclassified Microcoleus TaxID=2642155 RepID=UPI002FD243CB